MNWKRLLKVIFTIGFLTWLVRSQDWSRVGTTLVSMDRGLFALAMLLSLVMVPLQAIRWKVMLAGSKGEASLGLVFRYTALGFFANLFLPSSIGGDAVKSVGLGRATQSLALSVASTFLARVLGMLALFLLFWVFLAFAPEHLPQLKMEIPAMSFVGLGFLVLGVLFALIPKLALPQFIPFANRFNSLLEAIWSFRSHPKLLGNALMWSVLIQIANVCFSYLAFRSMAPQILTGGALLAIPLIVILATVPVTIFNVGVKESLAIFFLGKLAGLPPEACVAGTFIGYLAAVLQALPGLYYFLRPSRL